MKTHTFTDETNVGIVCLLRKSNKAHNKKTITDTRYYVENAHIL